MSVVIVDVDNAYCQDLCYSYQILRADDGTYSVYQTWNVLRGRWLGRDFDSLRDAWRCLDQAMTQNESFGDIP